MERTLDVAPIRGRREPKGRGLAQDELSAVFEAWSADENAPAGARDGAVLAILYGGGLRRTEVATVDLEHLRPTDGGLRKRGKCSGNDTEPLLPEVPNR